MVVGIVGLGLMGASLGLALHEARPELEVVGTDSDQRTMARAVERGVVRREAPPAEADVVFLAPPIAALPDVLASLSGHRGTITDLASTKARVMRWAAAAGVDLVGGHPMCGRERSGIEAADAAIFRGAPWILTRDEAVVTELVRAVGAHPIVMDAERHDRLVAGVSHAAFVLSAAYMLALASRPDWPEMGTVAGPAFRDLTRLAAGDPALYSAIAATNRDPLSASVRDIESALARLRRHLEAGDARLAELFEEAKLARDRWAADAGPD